MISTASLNRKWPHAPLSVLAGLVCAQIVATFFVWQSNMALYQKTQALAAGGWFVVPTADVAKTLLGIHAALKGGLFYTLSIGAGLTLLTWAVLWLHQRFFRHNRFFLRSALIGWLLLIVAINSRGLAGYAILFVALIPSAAALPWLPVLRRSDAPMTVNRFWAMPACVLLLLTGIWSTQLNSDLFINIRDHVLLSNSVGSRVNDFYYRNTLYAAEAFKSFGQKNIRSCRIENIPEGRARERLLRILTARDILTVSADAPADLMVSETDRDQWRFYLPGDAGITISPSSFFQTPGDTLKQIARKGDRYGPLRRVIFFGLLIGFPCLLYMTIYACLRKTAGLFLAAEQATQTAGMFCLVFGLGLFAPMMGGNAGEIPKSSLNTVLESKAWPERVAALHQIAKEKLDIADFPSYRLILDSPLVVERYWLAQTLGFSRSPETYRDLLFLVKDAHPNVVCQALDALGRRKKQGTLAIIQQAIAASDHWYVQWYGYKAMRRLGWRQKP